MKTGGLSFFALAGTLACALPGQCRAVMPADSRTPALERWESLRFGAFVHYNIQQYRPDGKIDDYYRGDCRDPNLFQPTRLDIPGWIRSFKEAGMNYAVLTTRHTGGFLLWDSRTSRYSVVHSRHHDGSDIVRKFVEECRRQGIAPGLYYLMGGGAKDSFSCPIEGRRFGKAEVLAQLTELATQYGEIPYFWIDMLNWRPQWGLGDAEHVTAQEVYDLIKSHQPETLVTMNQHGADATRIRYFPTDIINGEQTPPLAPFYDPGRNDLDRFADGPDLSVTNDNWSYLPGKYYLPFELSMTSQIVPDGSYQSKLGTLHDSVWFTRELTRSERAPTLYLEAWRALSRGAANVLVATAPDGSGSMREDDVEQLRLLGNLIHGRAGIERFPGSMVSRVARLGGPPRSDFDGEVGCRITVGRRPLRVTHLGRFRALGNRGRHRLSLVGADGKRIVSTWIDFGKGPTPDLNGFVFAPLPRAADVPAGAVVELLSRERPGHAGFYGRSHEYPALVSDGNIRVEGAIARERATHRRFHRVAGACSGPVAMAYTTREMREGGLMAHWNLAAGASFWIGKGGWVFEDLSGNGNDAVLKGAAVVAKGAPGGAATFDGGPGHLSVEDSATLAAGTYPQGRITLAATIQPDRLDGVRNILAQGYTVSPDREVFLRIRDGFYEAGVWSDSAGTPLTHSATFQAPESDLGRKVRLAGVYDGGKWILYRDGAKVAESPSETGAVHVPTGWAIGGCWRGRCAGGETRGYSGRILEARVYNRALDAAEVRATAQGTR